MELNQLTPAKGSIIKKNKFRKGRGQGSGKGGTSTRGHKGQKSRSGYSKKKGFEGGQMPLQRRVPKFGFKNINRLEYRPINLDILQNLVEVKNITDFTIKLFKDLGLATKNDKIKILGRGKLKSKITVQAHKFSNSAQESIIKAGGEVKNI